jgi:alanine racemase
VKEAERLNITVSVGSVEYAKEVFSIGSPKAHLQIDTGMSRMGLYCHKKEDVENALAEAIEISNIAGENLTGIYTHFVQSDVPDSDLTEIQYESFVSLISACEKKGITFKTKHCCNSLGTVNFENFALDAVRIGICLYGYESDTIPLTPAMTFRTKIIKIFEGKKGDTVSYCGTYTLNENKKIAVCSAGYADGVSRHLSNKGYYLVNGKKANILGRVCMDLSMIDVTDIDCKIGDEAIIFGKDLPATTVADICGTISYECLCAVSKRVPREYTE